jgi:hypothetical protein
MNNCIRWVSDTAATFVAYPPEDREDSSSWTKCLLGTIVALGTVYYFNSRRDKENFFIGRSIQLFSVAVHRIRENLSAILAVAANPESFYRAIQDLNQADLWTSENQAAVLTKGANAWDVALALRQLNNKNILTPKSRSVVLLGGTNVWNTVWILERLNNANLWTPENQAAILVDDGIHVQTILKQLQYIPQLNQEKINRIIRNVVEEPKCEEIVRKLAYQNRELPVPLLDLRIPPEIIAETAVLGTSHCRLDNEYWHRLKDLAVKVEMGIV